MSFTNGPIRQLGGIMLALDTDSSARMVGVADASLIASSTGSWTVQLAQPVPSGFLLSVQAAWSRWDAIPDSANAYTIDVVDDQVTVTIGGDPAHAATLYLSFMLIASAPLYARYVKLLGLSGFNPTAPEANADKIYMTGANGAEIERGAWTASADSENVGYPASNVLTDDLNDIWHTDFFAMPKPPYPHYLIIDTGEIQPISSYTYLPRQSGSSDTNIDSFELYLSDDGVTWGSPVASGTFSTFPGAASDAKVVSF